MHDNLCRRSTNDPRAQVMQVWYLSGWALHLSNDPEEATIALKQAQSLFEKNQCEEMDILAHIHELLAAQPPSNGSAAE